MVATSSSLFHRSVRDSYRKVIVGCALFVLLMTVATSNAHAANSRLVLEKTSSVVWVIETVKIPAQACTQTVAAGAITPSLLDVGFLGSLVGSGACYPLAVASPPGYPNWTGKWIKRGTTIKQMGVPHAVRGNGTDYDPDQVLFLMKNSDFINEQSTTVIVEFSKEYGQGFWECANDALHICSQKWITRRSDEHVAPSLPKGYTRGPTSSPPDGFPVYTSKVYLRSAGVGKCLYLGDPSVGALYGSVTPQIWNACSTTISGISVGATYSSVYKSTRALTTQAAPGMCLAIDQNYPATGAPGVLAPCSDRSLGDRDFWLSSPGGDILTMQLKRTGYCLDLPGNTTNHGTQVVTGPCSRHDSQRWHYGTDRWGGGYHPVHNMNALNVNKVMALDTAYGSGEIYTPVVQGNFTGGVSQRWVLIP